MKIAFEKTSSLKPEQIRLGIAPVRLKDGVDYYLRVKMEPGTPTARVQFVAMSEDLKQSRIEFENVLSLDQIFLPDDAVMFNSFIDSGAETYTEMIEYAAAEVVTPHTHIDIEVGGFSVNLYIRYSRPGVNFEDTYELPLGTARRFFDIDMKAMRSLAFDAF